MKKCLNCGQIYDDSWDACINDQSKLVAIGGQIDFICPHCDAEIKAGQKIRYCASCGQAIHFKQGAIQTGYDDSPYYQRIFEVFDYNGGYFKPSWNWAAFFFGLFWYFYKGMWAKALFILLVSIIFAFVPLFFFTVYCAIAGNYDYYLLKVKGKQLW